MDRSSFQMFQKTVVGHRMENSDIRPQNLGKITEEIRPQNLVVNTVVVVVVSSSNSCSNNSNISMVVMVVVEEREVVVVIVDEVHLFLVFLV